MDSFYKIFQQVNSCTNISDEVKSFLHDLLVKKSKEDVFGKPMPWIGMYIALASLFCILAMVADLFYGFRSRKLWFPCKYFTLNAASITLIAVAMKLPMDLSNPMDGDMDQIAKIGSMACMCTMMANLMPSIATMNNMELLTNLIALGFLVITVIVNVCIQIYTGVVDNVYRTFAMIYVCMLLLLLIIQSCSALTILKSKKIIELKYKTGHEKTSQQRGRLTVEQLKQHVSNHWIMARTGSPQFIIICSATTSASAVIYAFSAIFPIFVTIGIFRDGFSYLLHFRSDYKWSIPVILITQCLGIVLGAIAPFCRCFATLSFKLSIKWITNNIKVFKIESYWTQKLYDWKESNIPLSTSNRKSKIVIHNLKILILGFCIGFQMTIVVACKMISMIPIFFVLGIKFCIDCLGHVKPKAKYNASIIQKGGYTKKLENNRDHRNLEKLENNQDRRWYVLQLEDDMELADRTLDHITKSFNRLIQKAKKQQPNQLLKLLQKSEDFEGLRRYGSCIFHTSLVGEYHDSWSLPLVNLATIAIALINFQKDKVDELLSSVSQGLAYVTHVEESLNATDEYVSSQKAAKSLWIKVEFNQEWLEKRLKNCISKQNSTKEILEWFKSTSKKIVTEVVGKETEVSSEKLVSRSICAYSMYCICEALMCSYQDGIEVVAKDRLFEELLSMIAGILASCFTNIPQVIVMKCHTSVIEKREASVHAAAQLFGKTIQIINNLKVDKIPSLNPNELVFIHNWCAYFNHSIP